MEQEQRFESESLLNSAREFFSGDRTQRFMIGFLFGMAFFLIGAGLAEVLLARNDACIGSLSEFRLSPDPYEACMSEFEVFLARSLSRGLVGTLNPASSAYTAWFIMALLYGLIGGGFAQLSMRAGIAGFLIVHLLLITASMSLDYLSQFIILDFPEPPSG